MLRVFLGYQPRTVRCCDRSILRDWLQELGRCSRSKPVVPKREKCRFARGKYHCGTAYVPFSENVGPTRESLVSLVVQGEGMVFQNQGLPFHRGRIMGAFRFERGAFQVGAKSVPFCENSWGVRRSMNCGDRSTLREKPFHFLARAHKNPGFFWKPGFL